MLDSRIAKVDDSASRIFRILAGAEPKLRDAFLRVVARLRGEATLRALENLLEQGRLDEALVLGREAYEAFAQDWIEVFVTSGRSTSAAVARGLSVIVAFDTVNAPAVQAMQASRLRLIRELAEEQRGAILEALGEGVRRGFNPRQQARAFREAIGLTAYQERIVQNYRRDLETQGAAALRRELRDRRSDPRVLRAISGGEPLSAEEIDRMVARYRERWVKYRSEVIGRTEALRSVHEGVEESYRQAIASGRIDPDSIVRVWNTASGAKRPRHHPGMNGQERRIGEPFQSGAGNLLRYPGDSQAPPEDTVQCRCVLSTRFMAPGAVG